MPAEQTTTSTLRDQNQTTKCRRCKGVGYTDIDILPGVPPEPCHRCNGCGNEPAYMRSSAAWEIEFRRQATESGVPLDFQDDLIAMMARGEEKSPGNEKGATGLPGA